MSMEEKMENEPTGNGGENQEGEGLQVDAAQADDSTLEAAAAATDGAEPEQAATGLKRRRQEKVGLVTSDKMTKTVVVRVERQVRHPKYKRYIRKRSKFMAHDEMGAHIGDIVRIIETRPMSARKRWRVIEIVQKAS
ncbi:MAG TPA: 30S ribosomal protein S17 [Blastocatellia bacterium]|nr:30S ribosomal protein S17 [Blastocatellia bacterium]